MPATIILVDDHPVFRQGLRHLLAKEKDLTVVGEANDGQMAIDLVRQKCPDLVVMDINMPHLNGIEATRQIISACSATRVLALSVHSGKQFVRDMMEAGASGYILKESIPEEMIEGIRSVLAGNVYLNKSISSTLVSDYKALVSESRAEPDERSTQILYTKLHQPQIPKHVIPRTRLIEVLENGAKNPLTLIIAPAGYGKSILASQWLDVTALAGAWVSLDKGDNDLRVILSYIIEAIQSVVPQQELKTRSFLAAHKLPSVKVISQLLLNDLEQIPYPFILVLDDYHLIHTDSIHDLFSELLVHPSPHMHLVLLTRRDPSLPLISLRARGKLNLISTKDLRFTAQETKSFLERFLRIAITDNTAQVLEEKMEGWVTGLHLAALSIRNEADQERLIDGLLETTQFVRDYLIQEVFSIIPPKFRRHFLQTAILDRFCTPICEALSLEDSEGHQMEADASGRDFIDWLIKRHLFVIPLDKSNRWFRYHHLFRDLLHDQLKQRCSAEEITALHVRASEWFSGNSFIDEALKHALAAGNEVGAAQLLEQNRQAVLNADRWYVLERWLSMLPDNLVRQQPGLLLAKAWMLYHHFEISRIPPVIDAAEPLLSDSQDDLSLRGEIDFFRGYFYYFQNQGRASLKHLNDARNRVLDTNHEIRGQIEILHGLATQMQGHKEDALDTLNHFLLHPQWAGGITRTRLLVTLVYIHVMSGNLKQAAMANQRLHDCASKGNYDYARAWGVYLEGLIHFFRNDVDMAIDCFVRAIEQKYILHTRAAADSMAGLALAYQTAGKPEKAIATINDLRKFGHSIHDPTCSLIADSCQARLSIMQAKQKTMTKGSSSPVENMVWWIEIPAVTYYRALLAGGSEPRLQDAQMGLQKLLQLNQANHNVLQSISISSLLAVAHYKQGRMDEALKAAERALDMADSSEIIQPFVELGPPMADLLKQLRKRTAAVDSIENILSAFPDIRSGARSQINTPQSKTQNPKSKIQNSFIEPLTNREFAVLELLAQRLQNKEIADKLSVSPATVKTHLQNIYQKLDAGNRREAVEKAKGLKII
ncbi:MAG: response regulator [Desulfobacterales bacterium]